jgi:SPP1 gp7 family putative phage head morphogenesis protein
MAKSRDQYIWENSEADYNADLVSFSLIDEATVARLQREGDITLPAKKIDIPKDERWNTKQMSSKLLQGILNGDSIPKIAESLKDVIGNNDASAVRNARTLTTQAENAGRLDSYKNLESQGVVQKKVWMATPDDRTRKSHIDIDGEEVDINDEFSNGLMYPADPAGAAEEVWNCRCSMRTHIIGFKRKDGSIAEVGYKRDATMHNEQMLEEKARRFLKGDTLPSKPAKPVQQSGINRDYNSAFAKGYGQDYYNAMCDLVDKCDNEDLKTVWEEYQSQIRVTEPNYKGRGYASAGNIYVDKAKDAVGSSWQAKYETTFHESGHAIDHLSRDLAQTQGINFKFSSSYQNGAFPAMIRNEVDEMVKAKDAELKALFKAHKDDYEWLHANGFISDYSWAYYKRFGTFAGGGGVPKYSKSLAYSAVEREIKAHSGGGLAIADLSDIVEGATNARIQCGYGHGKSYWAKLMGVDEKLATEAFAEMTSATIANGESLKVLKEYLPKSYAMYEEMIKEIAKGGIV